MALEGLRPDPALMAAALILALVLDLAYPEHRGLTLKLHPVHTSYYMALALAKPHSSRLRGVVVWLLVAAAHLAPFALALLASYSIYPALWVVVAAITLKLSASLKLLLDICMNAYRGFSASLDEARRWVQLIVRRDVSRLDEPRVASAAIESLAESLVDGFTSPLLYYAILGPLGALAQRIANTLDGALGYKTPEYRDVGWFSARMDTAINYIPARLTAALIVLLSPIARGSVKEAYRVWRAWSRATESLNAGHPMSAMAGALGVKLEKPGYYTLNHEARHPKPEDIPRGVRLAVAVAIAHTLLCLTLTAIT